MEKDNQLNVVRIKIVPDIPLYSEKPIGSNEDVINLIGEELRTYDREVFAILNLDSKNRVLNFNIVSIGTLNSAEAHPREIFKSAILSNAAKIIAVHNHPSGDPTPSRGDIVFTKRLSEVAKLMRIDLLDHIIIGKNENFSFLENNDIYNALHISDEVKIVEVKSGNIGEDKVNYDNITKTFTHKDGRTYNILSLNGNDYLLQNQKTGDYIIANSLDVNSKEWSCGNYYSNTSKDLALASFDFAKKTDETVVNALLEKISHKELFFGVANLEDNRWKELSQQQKEAIYDTYMNDDIYTSILDQHILEQVDNTFESNINNIKEDFVMETTKEYKNKTHYMKKAVIEGNLVWKSELENKTTAKGYDSKFVKALVNCYDKGGKKTFSLVAWDEMAEQLSTVEKNQKISIIAYPRYTEYEKDGKKHDSEQYVVQAIDRDNQISKQIDMLLNDYCKGRISQIYENPAHEYGSSIDYSNEMGTVKSQGISKDHDEELER